MTYIVRSPDIKIKYLAEIYKQQIIDEYKYDLPLLEDYIHTLIGHRLVEPNYETKLKNFSDTIKQFKLQLFLAGPRKTEADKIRKNLKIMRKNQSKYFTSIEYYRRQSLDYFADIQKSKYLLINTTYIDDKLVFDINNLDLVLFNQVTEEINNHDISVSEFRKLARHEDWRSYWSNNKNNVFGIPAMEYSEDQKTICMYSRMYDNVYEHPEAPSETVIEDDDALDGWFINLEETNKRNKKTDFISVGDEYTDVFVSAKNQEDANAIYDINSVDGKRILSERSVVLKSKNEVKNTEFKDVQMDYMKHASDVEGAAMRRIK